jgi:proteic killer suppression protein
VDITFEGRLGKRINSDKARQKEFGELARVIGRRLDDLAALTTLDEAHSIPGRFEALSGERAGQFSLRLSGNWRLILVPANDPVPLREDGGIDLTMVTAIRVVEVVDYH